MYTVTTAVLSVLMVNQCRSNEFVYVINCSTFLSDIRRDFVSANASSEIRPERLLLEAYSRSGS